MRLFHTATEDITFCRVWIDGVRVGKIPMSGQGVVFPVTPGAHNIQVRMPGLTEALDLAPWISRSAIVGFHASSGEHISFGCAVDPPTPTDRRQRRQLGPRRFVLTQQRSEQVASEPRILEMQQTTRFDEALGEDVRIIDNQSSPAPVTRTLKASREWTRTLTVAQDEHRAATSEAGANLLWLSAKASIEQELQRSLSLAIGVTHLFEEQITVTVPEYTSVRVVLGT